MEKLEKNTIKKDRRIINLKEKFLIKTVEEDNSLSIDKMFSENSYSNFIKTFERMEDLVRKTNKAMVIQNYNAVDEEISDKVSELKYVIVIEEYNNFKANQEKLEKNIDTFLDFLEENENDIYSTSFELNREKLTKQYKSEKEFNKTLDLIKDVDKDFCFSIVKSDNSTEFKVVTEDKEFISNDYKELKKQLLDEVNESIKGNKSLENKIKEKYDDEYLKSDYDLSIEEDFKFSYISKGYEVETHIVVDKGNEKFELSGVETEKNIAEINRILTMEDYIETYNIKPRLYIMQVRDMENGLFHARWHEFKKWSYTGTHSSGGSIEPFYTELSLEDVKRKASKENPNSYLKISMETVDILTDYIWEELEKEKMNIKEELEIIPYKKKNLKELF